MRILTLGLSLFVVVILFASGNSLPQSITAHTGAAELLSPEEMDCIVGGEAGCGEVMGAIYNDCMAQSGSTYADPEAYARTAASCMIASLWGGVICGLEWLWGLIF